MGFLQIIRTIGLLIGVLALTACGVAPEKRLPASEGEIAELRAQILALGPDVDAGEADRAARPLTENKPTRCLTALPN